MSQDTPLPSRNKNRAPAPKASKPGKKKFRWGRFFFILLGVIILALVAYVGYLYIVGDKNLTKIAKPEEGNGAIVIPAEERAQVKPISLTLLGLDTRSETGSMNTDVMMVAAFNPVTKTATVVSIPRDSDLNLDGYKKHKANAYYAAFYMNGRNKEKLEKDKLVGYARDETRLMLSKFFDIPIDYTAVLDFQGFVDVVDALGGVTVTVDKDMRYIDSVDGTNIDLKKGEQPLKGEQALGFVRYRKSNHNRGFKPTAESSDFERNERQSQVLGAITDKLKSFSSISKVDDILNAVGDNIRTDIPKAQIENIIATYFGINRSDIRFIPLPGTWKSPYVYLDEDKLKDAKKALAEELNPEGRPAAGEDSASSPPSPQ
ncbi:LCP family protein [Cohnella terricola]|uniref:LytR family transcriptional regulator n=1 Tax=Cohnella terricola TaxID=1289167 RepID=A0A559JL14_9BACL|nr:LCP family protein [Cohnella terricola]TVY00560.1 LytR family transcriptional regulator [Cohnella terricola]